MSCISRGEYVDKGILEKTFLKRSEYMLEHNVPLWVGEFGPVYPPDDPDSHPMRYEILRDQLEIYARHGVNWAIWTYKDVGLQGVVYATPDSPWTERIRPIIEKKARLGVDAWGGTDAKIRHVMEPLEELFTEEYPGYALSRLGPKERSSCSCATYCSRSRCFASTPSSSGAWTKGRSMR
jgi:endoglucanase